MNGIRKNLYGENTPWGIVTTALKQFWPGPPPSTPSGAPKVGLNVKNRTFLTISPKLGKISERPIAEQVRNTFKSVFNHFPDFWVVIFGPPGGRFCQKAAKKQHFTEFLAVLVVAFGVVTSDVISDLDRSRPHRSRIFHT